jgi:hypothetical protein
MLNKEKNQPKRERKTMKKTKILRISFMLFTLAFPTIARTDTIQRFIYRDIADTSTLPKGKQELSYRFWLDSYTIKDNRLRNSYHDLTYRIGLTDRVELGINQGYLSASSYYKSYIIDTASGLTALKAYGKYQILTESICPVTLSLGGTLVTPTGSSGSDTIHFYKGGWSPEEFVAISKNIGSWTFGGHFALSQTAKPTSYSNKSWSLGAIENKSGLNIEYFGTDDYQLGLVGVTKSNTKGYIQCGLMFPIDEYEMDWRFILGLGFYF